jgi:hypothetical protein
VADSLADGRTRVSWVSTIANQNAPTAAELNAGTALQSLLTPDGLNGFQPDTADVDVSALDSTFNTTIAGRASFSGTALRLKKQTGTDAVYNLLVKDLQGFVVIRRDVTASTTFTTGDKVEVYPSWLGEVKNLDPEANSVHKYEVPVKVSSTPSLRATVA